MCTCMLIKNLIMIKIVMMMMMMMVVACQKGLETNSADPDLTASEEAV